MKIFLRAYQKGELPPSFSTAHAVLNPKTEDADKLQKVIGYRPITFCNVDFKVFAKVLTNRVQTIIGDLLGDHQTCGIRGMTINTNTHVARSVLDSCMLEGRCVAMLQIDLEKALDRVRYDAL